MDIYFLIGSNKCPSAASRTKWYGHKVPCSLPWAGTGSYRYKNDQRGSQRGTFIHFISLKPSSVQNLCVYCESRQVKLSEVSARGKEYEWNQNAQLWVKFLTNYYHRHYLNVCKSNYFVLYMWVFYVFLTFKFLGFHIHYLNVKILAVQR